MRKYKSLIYRLFFFLIALVTIVFYFNEKSIEISGYKDTHDILNHNYIINNNIAQYSSYLLENNEEIRAEIFIQYQLKYKINYENINDYRCLVKLYEKVIEILPSYSPRFYWEINKKLVFNFKRENFENELKP